MAQTNTWNVYSNWALDIFIEKEAIAQFEKETYFMNLWVRKTLPKWTNSYKFNRVDAWTLNASWVLTEWVAPSETNFSMNQVEVNMNQLWAFTKVSDLVLSDAPVDVIKEAWREIWRLLAEQADKNIQDVLDDWTNVIYAWDATDRASIDATDVVAATNLADTFSKLKANSAPQFDWNWYVAVLHPYVINDLFKDAWAWNFIEVNKYSKPEQVLKWEVWKLFWIRIVDSANIAFYADAWADSTVDVYPSYIMWKNAYWVVTSENMAMKVNLPWSAWTSDPLAQVWTIWWKLRFWSAILKEESLFRIESATSLWANS